jgi:hypothetical protein
MLPLHCGNDFMTTVFEGAVTDYKPNAKVTFKNNKLAVAGEGDVVIGIVRAADKHHLGCDGVVFTACYHI